MKVLYIQPGPGIGGAKVSLYNLLKHLSDSQSSYVVLSKPCDKKYEKQILGLTKKIDYLSLPTWQKYNRTTFIEKIKEPLSNLIRILNVIPAVIRLMKIINKEQIQIVHTNSAICPAGAIASYLLRIPHVWHIREPIGSNGEYPLIVGDRLSKLIINITTDVIVCNSIYTGLCFDQKSSKLNIIQNGVDVEIFQSQKSIDMGLSLRSGFKHDSNSFNIGIVGNLTSWKRHDIFLLVAQKISELFPEVVFYIFGSMSEEKLYTNKYARSLQKMIYNMDLKDKVQWVKFIENPAIIYHSIDLLVHPASKEGSGRVIMEALASGTAAIGVDSGGVRELIEDGVDGYLVDVDDVDSIVKRIIFLIENPETKKIIETNGVKKSQNIFSNEVNAKSIRDIYNKLLYEN